MSLRSITSSARGRRLMRGFGATALNPVVTAAIQLIPVPLLIHAWGAAKYGDWLLLSAIPSSLALSDLGFGDASGSDMTMRVAAGDREGALRTFQSSWALLTVVSLVLVLCAGMLVWRIPWQKFLHLSSLSSQSAAVAIFLMATYTVMSQQMSVIESGFRCDGNFATGTVWLVTVRVAEAALASTVGIISQNLILVALTYLSVKALGTLMYALLLRHKSPWLKVGIRHARISAIRELAAPAVGFTAFPISYALSIQGFPVVIGALLGPVAVTAFSTLRTLTRVNFQMMTTIGWSIWPELSSAFGAGDLSLARRLHRRACQAAFGVAIAGGIALWILGPFIYRLWIRNKVAFDAHCFHILLVVTFANCLWFVSSIVLMSTNTHHRLAWAYATLAATSLLLARLLIPQLGLSGAAWALALPDGLMIYLVMRTSLGKLEDNFVDFFRSFFSLPSFWPLRRETVAASE